MLTVKYTSKFKKELKLAEKQHKDINRLMSVIDSLRQQIPLEARYKDHPLLGEYHECRECHVTPDLVLVYKIYEDISQLLLIRLNSHSNLF